MTYLVNGIDISSLIKARNKFEAFRKHLDTEQNKAGAIQAFEFCYELSWKTMKRLVESGGKNPYYLKEIFRETAVSGLISDPKVWFNFINIRNITVHTYNEKAVEQVIKIFDGFSNALSEFLRNLENKSDSS